MTTILLSECYSKRVTDYNNAVLIHTVFLTFVLFIDHFVYLYRYLFNHIQLLMFSRMRFAIFSKINENVMLML